MVKKLVVQVFMSHTKLDKEFCDRFDIAAPRVGVRVFRSEFEDIKSPAWKTIKKQMDKSSAMFLLVGKELVKAQAMSGKSKKYRDEWKHTQNWIAYEIGLACQRGIDVWVVCDENVTLNFPVPYLNNYLVYGLGAEEENGNGQIGFIRWVLEEYSKKRKFALGRFNRDTKCPYENCGAEFNLHTELSPKVEIICPTCCQTIVFPKGWLLNEE